MTKIIRRNAKKQLETIFKTATNILSYNLDSCFRGEEVGDCGDLTASEWIEKVYNSVTKPRLTTDGNGNFSMQVHSNLWYEFKAKA